MKRFLTISRGSECSTGKAPSAKRLRPERTAVDCSSPSSDAFFRREDPLNANLRLNPRSILTWNANGLPQRMRKATDWAGFKEIVARKSPDVIGIQEVRLPAQCPAGAKKDDGQPRQRGLLKLHGKGASEEAGFVMSALRKPPFSEYKAWWSLADWKYAGQLLLVKQDIKVQSLRFNADWSLPSHQHNAEGRVICAEFEKFVVLTSYVPNHGWGINWDRRREWDEQMTRFLSRFNSSSCTDVASDSAAPEQKSEDGGVADGLWRKPLIWFGDLNIAPLDVDLSEPCWFRTRTDFDAKVAGDPRCLSKDYIGQPGCTDVERRRFASLIEAADLTDAYRDLNQTDSVPDAATNAYTWRGTPGVADPAYGKYYGRGMRIDHFLATRALSQFVTRVEILGHGADRVGFCGSDHSPMLLELDIEKIPAPKVPPKSVLKPRVPINMVSGPTVPISTLSDPTIPVETTDEPTVPGLPEEKGAQVGSHERSSADSKSAGAPPKN